MENEIWKKIEEYNGDYFISNLGRVKSFKQDKINGIILNIHEYNKGYFRVKLYKNGKCETKKIHRLVYDTFNNQILNENECVHHIDENKKNNYVYNLELMMISEHNSFHNKNENHPMFGSERLGEKSGNHKLKNFDIIEIRRLSDEGILTQKEIAKMFGVSRVTISNIKNRKYWKHI